MCAIDIKGSQWMLFCLKLQASSFLSEKLNLLCLPILSIRLITKTLPICVWHHRLRHTSLCRSLQPTLKCWSTVAPPFCSEYKPLRAGSIGFKCYVPVVVLNGIIEIGLIKKMESTCEDVLYLQRHMQIHSYRHQHLPPSASVSFPACQRLTFGHSLHTFIVASRRWRDPFVAGFLWTYIVKMSVSVLDKVNR